MPRVATFFKVALLLASAETGALMAGERLFVDGTGTPELAARSEEVAGKARVLRSATRAFAAEGDFGEIAVLEDDGTLVVDGVSNSDEIVRRFFESHPDQYDHVAINFDFPMTPEAGFAFERNVRNDVQGIGLPIFDNGATYGTTFLTTFINMNDLGEYTTYPYFGVVLSHEAGHRFLAYVDTQMCGTFLLSSRCIHWSFYHSTGGSFLYGHDWIDNGNGTFTSSNEETVYGEVDQYLMGLRDAATVTQPLFVLQNPSGCLYNNNPVPCPTVDDIPLNGYTVTATKTPYTVADILNGYGPRIPDAATAPKAFRMAFVLVVAKGLYPPSPASLAKLDGFRQQFEPSYVASTSGLGSMDTRLYLPGEPPHPAFYATPTKAIPGTSIQFTDDSRNGPVASWSWDFGDGTTSSARNPVHSYGAPGLYDVKLTVANLNGAESRTKSGYVDIQIRPPVADFVGDVSLGPAPLTVSFTDQSIWSPATWLWDFGDGSTSTAQNPTHVYTTPNASFLVKMTATNVHGANVRGRPNYVVTGTKIYQEGFESGGPGWTHGANSGTDDWQVGPPQGDGGDPAAAHGGAAVYGTDLGGATDGKYTPGEDSWLLSPGIDGSSASHVALTYWRWLTVEDGLYDHARMTVNNRIYYSNPVGTGVSRLEDWYWTPETFDVTKVAAGDPAFHVRFSMQTDGSIQFGGWNVDDVAVYSTPEGPYWNGPRILAGPGHGPGNPNQAEIVDGLGRVQSSWLAYGSGTMGTNVAGSDVDGDGFREAVTGPGPGPTLGPHVRAFNPWDGTPIAKVSYYAYGTLRYGVNVAGGNLDGDRFDEIGTGPGAGAVFGPHVRGWNVDNGAVTAISKVSYFAYSTLKYGCLVAQGDVDTDPSYDEIVTGPGPGANFSAHLRGWNYDGASITPLPGFSAFVFSPSTYGLNVGTADLAGADREEILAARGPAPTNIGELEALNYASGFLGVLNSSAMSPFVTLYGVRVGGGELGAPKDHLVAGPGPAPTAPSQLRGYTYTVASPPGWRVDQDVNGVVFPTFYGTIAAVGNIQ
ncbi:MAG: PKD domain-containing protein [Acidobacteriota bacterium]